MAAMMTLQAGQIQIGGTNGLTTTYMGTTATASAGCSANAATIAQAGYNGCVSSLQATGIGQRNYVATLFQNATGATSPSGTTFTDAANGNVTFSRIQGDTVSSTGGPISADLWAPSGTPTTASIFVPVGVYGVDKAWTMLQNYWGGNGQVGDISVAFRWDDSSNGAGGTTSAYNQTFNLKEGETIRSAVACSDNTVANCKTVNGSLPISTTIDSLVSHGGVTANNIFADSTGNSIGATPAVGSRYANLGGLTFYLDNQMFDFGSTHLTEFLVSMSITTTTTASGSGYTSATLNTNNTRAALSAITVNQAAIGNTNAEAPEPSTIFLAFAGLGVVGYYRRRKA